MNEWWKEFITFRKFITPLVMPVVFWLGVGIAVIMGFITLVDGAMAGSAGLIFQGIITIFLGPLFVRILCELVLVLFTKSS
ncbi:MAG: DUF4282 domain-containing protein [Candidatus Bipolaricaulaceae bacterium]